MKIIEPVLISVVQEHEQTIDANVRLDRYDLEKHCPISEFKAFRTKLEAHDIERLFLLGNFVGHTADHTGLVANVLAGMEHNPRVRQFTSTTFDLRSATGRELVIVTVDEKGGALIIIDGNHRTIAQNIKYRTVENVPAYVCVHGRVNEWAFVPHAARSKGT